MNKNFETIAATGQSLWYDNLSRDVLNTGTLTKLIESGVVGLTSNPSIFKKAIADSSDYDAELKTLNGPAEEVCEDLMIKDVAAAADLLRPIYDRTKGVDGCASIEVSPYLARDAQGTVEAAKRIWGKVDRPNVMIKIPGTVECLPAIRATLVEGINVNITLLFSLQDYEQVVDEYLTALEIRASRNLPIDRVVSVASFFVSRVDALYEKRSGELLKQGAVTAAERDPILNKIGVANALVAYDAFEKLFASKRFDALKKKGALVQRPLWASTGTKSEALPKLHYVTALAMKETVNTAPPATLQALLEASSVTVAPLVSGTKEACTLFEKVSAQGLPFGGMMRQLQNDGVTLFADAYRDLLQSIDDKRSKIG